jgi:hypothetical protein
MFNKSDVVAALQSREDLEATFTLRPSTRTPGNTYKDEISRSASGFAASLRKRRNNARRGSQKAAFKAAVARKKRATWITPKK